MSRAQTSFKSTTAVDRARLEAAITDPAARVDDLLPLGTWLIHAGRPSDAETVLRRALGLDPQNAGALQALGVALGAQGRFSDAQAWIARALVRRPDADGYFNLGLSLQHAGKTREAMAAYGRAIELKPRHAAAICNLAVACHGLDDFAGAAALYRRALAVDPEVENARAYLGAALLAQGDHAGAEAAFRDTVDADPGHPLPEYALAKIELHHDRYETCVLHLERALERLAVRRDWRTRGLGSQNGVKRYNTGLYRKALEATLTTLRAGGIEPVLVAGTLIAAMREKSLMTFDKDVDVAVGPGIDPLQIEEAMKADSRFVRVSGLGDDTLLPAYVFEEGAPVDIFRLFEEDDRTWYGLYWRDEAVKWVHAPFGRREITWDGLRVTIPDDADRFLTECYGDWRTPNPYFEAWATPNIEGGFRPYFRCLAYGSLFKAAWSGHHARARDLCGQILNLDPGNDIVARVLAVMEEAIADPRPGQAAGAPPTAILGSDFEAPAR